MRLELYAAGLKAYFVETAASALSVIEQWSFDVALVDTDDLGAESEELLRDFVMRCHTPVTAMTSDGDERVIRLLGRGASQVFIKPVSPRVVAVQLRRLVEVIRTRRMDDANRVQIGPVCLDPRRGFATVAGKDVGLTPSEFELLLLLATDQGELVHRDTIGRTLRLESATKHRRTGDMHICRIRRKLKEVGCEQIEIVTVYNRGYLLRLVPEGLEESEGRVEWSV